MQAFPGTEIVAVRKLATPEAVVESGTAKRTTKRPPP